MLLQQWVQCLSLFVLYFLMGKLALSYGEYVACWGFCDVLAPSAAS